MAAYPYGLCILPPVGCRLYQAGALVPPQSVRATRYRSLEEIVPEQNDWGAALAPPVAAHVRYIVSSFANRIPIGVVPAGRGVGFMYAEGQILVRSEYLDRVRDILGLPADPDLIVHVVPGVVLLLLAPPPDREQPTAPDGEQPNVTPEREQPTVLVALARIAREFGAGVATPDYVLTVAPDGGPCPATEPQAVYEETEPNPGICHWNSGAGVLVYVADTGLLADAPATVPWLRGVRGDLDPLPQQEPDGTQTIPPYTGHGTFVAGVLRCQAPEAEVYVANAFAVAGSTLESDLVLRLAAALDFGVDIFHLSITATTMNDQPLLALAGWLELLRQYKGVTCVVAAGNNGSRRRCWPAAFAETVSVGALGADWCNRARFSNFGSWVDVYAPGRDIVNAFATGSYACYVPPYSGEVRKFYGMARWSGTSFSTPLVTGLIAARMSRTGENGKQAAEALLAQGRRQAIPGVGPILLPCCDLSCRDDGTRSRPAGSPCGGRCDRCDRCESPR
jgi:hypothetical protein